MVSSHRKKNDSWPPRTPIKARTLYLWRLPPCNYSPYIQFLIQCVTITLRWVQQVHTQTHKKQQIYIIVGPVLCQAACIDRFLVTIFRDKRCSPRLPPPRSVLQGRGKPAGGGGGWGRETRSSRPQKVLWPLTSRDLPVACPTMDWSLLEREWQKRNKRSNLNVIDQCGCMSFYAVQKPHYRNFLLNLSLGRDLGRDCGRNLLLLVLCGCVVTLLLKGWRESFRGWVQLWLLL